MAVVVAFFGGTIPILTRKLKDIPASIMMFYMGLLGSILMAVLIGAEAYYNKSELHTVSYTGEQFFLIITSTIFSAIATSVSMFVLDKIAARPYLYCRGF